MVLQSYKKGDQGIGTLIIFIAMILVAAVAAGVLIQTASSLQSKSLDVGRQSQEKITTSLEVMQVFANDTSDHIINASVDEFHVIVRLGSGSEPIKLGDLIVKLDGQGASQTMSYNATVGAGTDYYNVKGLKNYNIPGYLLGGDLVEIFFVSGASIAESDTITIRLIAKNGAVQPVQITTPSSMTSGTTYLFP